MVRTISLDHVTKMGKVYCLEDIVNLTRVKVHGLHAFCSDTCLCNTDMVEEMHHFATCGKAA